MTAPRNRSGQFIPISAMVMFTIVVLMVAVVNIYKVTRAKLKIQNLADAIALNIATNMAADINVITDRNQMLNHMYGNDNATVQALENKQDNEDCPTIDRTKEIPPLSCAEYAKYSSWKEGSNGRPQPGGFVFNSGSDTGGNCGGSGCGANGYANLVKAVNDAQRVFEETYNTFLGATPGVGKRALSETLKSDIPDLVNDPTIRVVTWNSSRQESDAKSARDSLARSMARGQAQGPVIDSHMDLLKFRIHDMNIAFERRRPFGRGNETIKTTMGALVNNGSPVGWYEIDPNTTPTMRIVGPGGQMVSRIGAGAYVLKTVDIVGRPVVVSARATAYVVPGSGSIPGGNSSSNTSGPATKRPVFKPSYYVKLGDK